jgi:hypothetical protein
MEKFEGGDAGYNPLAVKDWKMFGKCSNQKMRKGGD